MLCHGYSSKIPGVPLNMLALGESSANPVRCRKDPRCVCPLRPGSLPVQPPRDFCRVSRFVGPWWLNAKEDSASEQDVVLRRRRGGGMPLAIRRGNGVCFFLFPPILDCRST